MQFLVILITHLGDYSQIKHNAFQGNNVNTLSREDWWSKESTQVKLEQLSLNKGGGVRHHLSPTYYAVMSSPSRQLNNHSHLGSPSSSNPREGQLGQRPTSGPKISELTCVLNDSVSTRS